MGEIDQPILALIEELKTVQTQADLLGNLEAWKNITEFDWYLFALNRTKSMQKSEHVVLTNYPAEWMEKYEAEKLFQKDPVVKYVMNHQNNIFWDSFKDLDGYNSPEQLDVGLLNTRNMNRGFFIGHVNSIYQRCSGRDLRTQRACKNIPSSMSANHFYFLRR